jgi:hypothetical protein
LSVSRLVLLVWLLRLGRLLRRLGLGVGAGRRGGFV